MSVGSERPGDVQLDRAVLRPPADQIGPGAISENRREKKVENGLWLAERKLGTEQSASLYRPSKM